MQQADSSYPPFGRIESIADLAMGDDVDGWDKAWVHEIHIYIYFGASSARFEQAPGLRAVQLL